jgi:hypothetical protein
MNDLSRSQFLLLVVLSQFLLLVVLSLFLLLVVLAPLSLIYLSFFLSYLFVFVRGTKHQASQSARAGARCDVPLLAQMLSMILLQFIGAYCRREMGLSKYRYFHCRKL